MKKDRPTPRRADVAARVAAQVVENRTWREKLAARYSKIRDDRKRHRDNEKKKRAADLGDTPLPVLFIHETADLGWSRDVRRRAQLNRRSSTGTDVRIPPSPNQPYVNRGRDVKKADAARKNARREAKKAIR